LLHMSSARKKTAEEINLDYIAGQPNVVWPYRGGQTFVEQRPCRFCRRFHGPRWHEIACECLHYTLNAHKVKCGDATLWQIERARRILGARRIGDKVDGNGFLPNCTGLALNFSGLAVLVASGRQRTRRRSLSLTRIASLSTSEREYKTSVQGDDYLAYENKKSSPLPPPHAPANTSCPPPTPSPRLLTMNCWC